MIWVFVCDFCKSTDSAKPGELPRGWYAHGPSTLFASTKYYCNSDCSLRDGEAARAAAFVVATTLD
jgi:hypothetical protein